MSPPDRRTPARGTPDPEGLPPPAGRTFDVSLELLDRQIVDVEGNLAGKVDDLELTELEDGSMLVTAILSGPGALGPRVGGRFGAAISALFARLHPDVDPSPARIAFGVVTSLGPQVRLLISRHDLDVNRLERWTRDHVVARIPGGGHAGR